MRPQKSLGDPILDAQRICADLGPQTPEELLAEMAKLGWSEKPAGEALHAAIGIFLYGHSDGRIAVDPE